MSRTVDRVYRDPLELVWVETARRLGFRIERRDDVYATTDGAAVIGLGEPASLDADDCLAQMILHELCHALVQGPTGEGVADWGLCNRTERDVPREHACLRLQAALCEAHGLRAVLAPTTDFRAFYDALPEHPLAGPPDAADVALARDALARAARPPYAPHLQDALAATAAVVRAVRTFAEHPSLFAARRHPAGAPGGLEADVDHSSR